MQVKQCLCFIFHLFQFSRNIPCPTVCISYFSRFQSISPYSRSQSVFVSFCMIFSFLDILQVLQCAFLIFHVFHSFSPYSRSDSVCFSFFTFFSVSRHIPGPTCEFLVFLVCQFSHHIPGPTVCASYFPRFSVFSP